MAIFHGVLFINSMHVNIDGWLRLVGRGTFSAVFKWTLSCGKEVPQLVNHFERKRENTLPPRQVAVKQFDPQAYGGSFKCGEMCFCEC